MSGARRASATDAAEYANKRLVCFVILSVLRRLRARADENIGIPGENGDLLGFFWFVLRGRAPRALLLDILP